MVAALWARSPRLQRIALRALDRWACVVLLPFRRPRPAGRAIESEALVRQTDAYNAAAEDYFARVSSPDFLLRKPFSDAFGLSKHLIDAGVLLRAMRLQPGHVVLELGAGTCWLSHMINLFGCRTVSVDVSRTALGLGRVLFERHPHTRWDLSPAFVPYDGHRLPIRDGTCDRVVISDAFHHFPNQRELFGEMLRVLTPTGIVAMSEPGRGHGSTAHSLRESRETGVLENELVVEDVAALARDCGFAAVRVVAASPFVWTEIDADRLAAFMGGEGFAGYWLGFCGALEGHHYVVCLKGEAPSLSAAWQPPSATVALTRPPALAARVGEPIPIALNVTNTGAGPWVGGTSQRPGWTRLGAHLYDAGPPRRLADYDWWRGALPARVVPGAPVAMEIVLPGLERPGRYAIEIDVVIEGVAWLSTFDSTPPAFEITIE